MIKHKGNQEYEGLSTDTKPVAADTAVNATFAETDTGLLYRNNGTTWVEYGGGTDTSIPLSVKYLVYKSGSTFYAKNGDTGVIDSSNSSPTIVIQYALDNLNEQEHARKL